MNDKTKHFIAGFVFTFVLGFWAGFGVCLGKELWDEAAKRWPRFTFEPFGYPFVSGTGFDILDLLAGLCGVGLALLVRSIRYKELGQ